ncbi:MULTISPECIES: DUF2993 domain-containing protein [unclassified Leptolyngbya]|uniref:LmeA family phospholipid-binding protein n=1 Tax=unclassified Leptolyngbya TaxID=2650499 RepID=UPI0016862AD7|nr:MULTISPECIES: DUF2993 domain-containing protein [unclassified Leptolyngbya]MBD1909505.1 DUF2993 domain-containing protein [Leptolyngbya sp. FACHB-8]MBD2159010.1 DUF2993 domain-containing protein [Leptolyngbya sp. FACHB-16]
MEFLTLLLITLMGLVSPVGFVADRLAADALRQRLESAEDLDVRIDNAPSYRLAQGRVQRVRVAGEGIVPLEGVRIEELNLEAEGVALDPGELRDGTVELKGPLEAGIQLVLTEEDLNQALQSPVVTEWLEDASVQVPGAASIGMERYTLLNPQIQLLEGDSQGDGRGDRLRFQVTLQERRNRRQIPIELESGFAIDGSRRVRLIDPAVSVEGVAVPAELLQALTQGGVVDLQTLGGEEILVRLLQLEVEDDQVAIAAWVRVAPERNTP